MRSCRFVMTVVAVLLGETATLQAEDTGENVEGILGYGEKTVEVSTAQDMEAAVDSKHDITVVLYRDIEVTDKTPVFDRLIDPGPCWEEDSLFNLSNYVFKPFHEQIILHLSFNAADGVNVGKVVRNGRAEFLDLGNVVFSGIHNVKEDVEGTYSPFQPVSNEENTLTASDTTACYGYGGVFSSASGLVNGEDGGVGFYDNAGKVTFQNISYDGSSMGDVNCAICLHGGAIYADAAYDVQILRNGLDLGGDVMFNNVAITLDRSAYEKSSQVYFYGYGGAIYTRNLSIEENGAGVKFQTVGISQVAVNHDEGYGYGGALYLSGSGNSISSNAGTVSFTSGYVTVANEARGGAIYLASGAELKMDSNGGVVSFVGNRAQASAIDGTLNDDALARGGAIYLADNSRLSICNNEDNVVFQDNEAEAKAQVSGASAESAGGAIWGERGSHIEISGNESNVIFSGNSAEKGSAIYTGGSLSIRNNTYVSFVENSGDYAVYMDNASSVLNLSAAQNNSVSLMDNLYSEGSAHFNADYEGETQQGTIEVSSASVCIKGGTVLHNGILLLNQGSTFDGALTLASAATLAAEGKQNVVSGGVQMAAGSVLALTLNGYNTAQAVLCFEDSLTSLGTFTLDVTLNGRPAVGAEYVLLQLADDYADAGGVWSPERVLVTGDVGFDELLWTENGTKLVYRVPGSPSVPEPASAMLCLVALVGGCARRRRSV